MEKAMMGMKVQIYQVDFQGLIRSLCLRDLVGSFVSQDIFLSFSLQDIVGSLLGFLLMYRLDCQLQKLNLPLFLYLCLSFLLSKIVDWFFAKYISIRFMLKYILILLSKTVAELVHLYQAPDILPFFFAYCIILVMTYLEEFYPESLTYCFCFLTRKNLPPLNVRDPRGGKILFLLFLNLIVLILLSQTVTKIDPLICIVLHCPKFLMYLFVFPISTLSLISTQRKSYIKPEFTVNNIKISRDETEFILATLDMSITKQEENKINDNMGQEEFQSLFEETEPSLDEVMEAFSVFDQNGDGYIDAYELHRVLKNLRLVEEDITYIEIGIELDRWDFMKVLELGLY